MTDDAPYSQPGRAAAFARFSAAVDGPMLVLAALMLPILIIPLIWPVRGAAPTSFDFGGYLISAALVAGREPGPPGSAD
jgi:hypothetical protein